MIKKNIHISMVDRDIMHNVFGNNQAAIVEYLESFIEITSKLLQNTDNAIREKNAPAVMSYFHQLHGSAGTIGFKKLNRLCKKAEEKIAAADWDSAMQFNHDMEKVLDKLQVELQLLKRI